MLESRGESDTNLAGRFIRPNSPRYQRDSERSRGRGVWHILGVGTGRTLCGRDADESWAWDWENKVQLGDVCYICVKSHQSK